MKIVIVGGGFCGVLIAKELDKKLEYETILIDDKPYFEYQPSLHKIICNPSYIKKIRCNYSQIFKNVRFIHDKVKKIAPTHIYTSYGKIKFDILVISTGIDYPILLDNKKDVHVLKNSKDALTIASKIIQANNILIVGGGVVGTEIAGEIVTKMPFKKLTIINSKNQMLKRIPKDASDYSIKFLTKNSVDIILNEIVKKNNDGVFITNKNNKINADLCIWCTGIKPNPDFIKDFPDKCFSNNNSLIVNRHLQLNGFSNIFVGGDITNITEEKTARKAELHAKIILKNINKIKNKEPLAYYETGKSPMIISLGDWRGIFYYKYIIPGLIIPGIIKWIIQWWFLRKLK
jgi:NADH dehydrogenase FAD-containing subunit